MARITGACSLPSKAKAPRPLARLLTASSVIGERASGGSETIRAPPGSENSKMDATLISAGSLLLDFIFNLRWFTFRRTIHARGRRRVLSLGQQQARVRFATFVRRLCSPDS